MAKVGAVNTNTRMVMSVKVVTKAHNTVEEEHYYGRVNDSDDQSDGGDDRSRREYSADCNTFAIK